MKTVQFLLILLLIFITSGFQLYSYWKKNDRKMVYLQGGILGLAVAIGGLIIYEVHLPSISKIFNTISPF